MPRPGGPARISSGRERGGQPFKLVSTKEQRQQTPTGLGYLAPAIGGESEIDEEKGPIFGWGLPACCCFILIGGLLLALSAQEIVYEQRKEA